ncbi:MAG: L,D-transpeptidase, partial [Myxococcota bacterium]
SAKVPSSVVLLAVVSTFSCSEGMYLEGLVDALEARVPAEIELNPSEESRESTKRIPNEPPQASSKKDAESKKPKKRIFAKRFVVNVYEEPKPRASKLGYMRAGSVLEATTGRAISTEGCPAGWYQLETGGFVCSRRDVIAFSTKRLPERRSRRASREEPLPYEYGRVLRERTPMFRRLPTDEEAAEYEEDPRTAEPQLAPVGAADEVAAGEVAIEPSAPANSDPSLTLLEEEGTSPVEDRAGQVSGIDPAPSPSDAPVADSKPQASESPLNLDEMPSDSVSLDSVSLESVSLESVSLESVSLESDLPESESLGPEEEPLTLASLAGDEDRSSVLHRWLVPGFYVSLDTTMATGDRRYWRTQANGFVPVQALRPVRIKRFHGVFLGATSPAAGGDLRAGSEHIECVACALPLGFVLSRRTQWFRVRQDGRVVRRPGRPGYHHRFFITDELEYRGVNYLVDQDGVLYRSRDITRVEQAPPLEDVTPGERWIDIDLGQQTLVAYEGERPVFATLISSGRAYHPGDEENYETPTGVFRVTSKHLTHTMDGDSAGDGPYSIEDVPYVMYFKLAYALHSAFWHNLFGRPRSHGCVNMSPLDARWLFDWASPHLPLGWHGAYPLEEPGGTRIRIHGETPSPKWAR